jgi:hypothetical protein
MPQLHLVQYEYDENQEPVERQRAAIDVDEYASEDEYADLAGSLDQSQEIRIEFTDGKEGELASYENVMTASEAAKLFMYIQLALRGETIGGNQPIQPSNSVKG